MKRRSLRRATRPVLQSLEGRIVLSGSNVGVNLDFNTSSGNPIWVNVANAFNQWDLYNVWWQSSPSVTVNSSDYPTTSASTYANLQNYPDGNYQLSYQGTANITFSGIGYLAAPITTNSSGVSTGTVVINHTMGDGSLLMMYVNGVSPTATFSNFQLDVPGYGSNPTQVFTNPFLQQLQPFSTIRTMNWSMTTTTTQTTWATATPSSTFETTQVPVPWSDIVALGNESQKNIWINIPAGATPDYVQGLAQLVHSQLDSNLKVYVEYGNETWASGGSNYNQALQASQTNPLISTTNNGVRVAQQSAYEVVAAAKIFDAAFGSQSSQVVPVMAGFSAYSLYGQTALQFIQANYGNVSQYVGEYAIAPYISANESTAVSLSQIFADMNTEMSTSYITQLQANASLAKSYGIPLAAYEGGQSLQPNIYTGLNQTVMAQAQNDPRMYQVYVTMMNLWNQYAGPHDLFMAYQLTGISSVYGYWGMLPTVASPGSQKYDALLSSILPAGDANLDGSVDYADLQTVEAFYGQTGTYWEQGDFNDAAATNWSDLNIVRQNIQPSSLTLQQFAQMALFGQPSAVVPGTTQEYDAYGVTYLSSLPYISTAGTVVKNANLNGTALSIVNNTMTVASGISTTPGSSFSTALGGAYSEFDAVLGLTNTGSSGSVIYQVYGDGKLLYQSGTISQATTALPISVNVKGVQTLTLDVLGVSGSLANAQATWADARLISTNNFGTATPYSVQWQISLNGRLLGTMNSDSFEFGSPIDGNYTLTVIVTNSQGQSASASQQINVGVQAPSSYEVLPGSNQVELDWVPVAGAAAYDVYRGTTSNPNSMVLVARNLKNPKYVDTRVTNGATYYYEIAAVDSGGVVGPRSSLLQAMPVAIASTNTFLSSLPVASQSGTVLLNRSAVPDSFSDGATMPLTLSNGYFEAGLGTSGSTAYAVNLASAYTQISLTFGLDANAKLGASETFVIVGDGKTLYTSSAITASSGETTLSLNVSGVQSLVLETIAGGTLAADYADWANVQFASAAFVPLTSVSWTTANTSYALNANSLGGPLIMNGTEDLQGIGAASGWSGTFTLNQNFHTLTLILGLDGLIGTLGNVNLQILINGGINSNNWYDFTPSNPNEALSVNVAGATSVTLSVTPAVNGTTYEDYADFALAELYH